MYLDITFTRYVDKYLWLLLRVKWISHVVYDMVGNSCNILFSVEARDCLWNLSSLLLVRPLLFLIIFAHLLRTCLVRMHLTRDDLFFVSPAIPLLSFEPLMAVFSVPMSLQIPLKKTEV